MYLVQPEDSVLPYRVFCDQTTQNGGQEAASALRDLRGPLSEICCSLQVGCSSRTDWTAAWTSAAAGTTTAGGLGTLPLMLEKVTATLRVRFRRFSREELSRGFADGCVSCDRGVLAGERSDQSADQDGPD